MTETPNEPPHRSVPIVILGQAIAVTGILFMGLSGLCTAGFVLPITWETFKSGVMNNLSSWLSFVVYACFLGGIGVGTGWLIWLAGRAIAGKR